MVGILTRKSTRKQFEIKQEKYPLKCVAPLFQTAKIKILHFWAAVRRAVHVRSLWSPIHNMLLITTHVLHMYLCTECMKNSSCVTNRTDSLQMETKARIQPRSNLIRLRGVPSDSARSHPEIAHKPHLLNTWPCIRFRKKKRRAGMREMHETWGMRPTCWPRRERDESRRHWRGYRLLISGKFVFLVIFSRWCFKWQSGGNQNYPAHPPCVLRANRSHLLTASDLCHDLWELIILCGSIRTCAPMNSCIYNSACACACTYFSVSMSERKQVPLAASKVPLITPAATWHARPADGTVCL